jgi:hypothetical protein
MIYSVEVIERRLARYLVEATDEAQALARAAAERRDKGGEAVRACLALVDLKRRLAGEENDHKNRTAATR